jgi:hypothetical protein
VTLLIGLATLVLQLALPRHIGIPSLLTAIAVIVTATLVASFLTRAPISTYSVRECPFIITLIPAIIKTFSTSEEPTFGTPKAIGNAFYC